MAQPCHVALDVREASQVGYARRQAAQWADTLGFDAEGAGRVALVATELGTNLIRHAGGGRLLIGAARGVQGQALVELISLDQGPGIRDLSASMVDGFSTAATPGNGLGAVRRLSAEFDIYSTCPGGTIVLARVGDRLAHPGTVPVRSTDAFAAATVAVAAPGETVCGDAWSLAADGARLALLMADGLGHGPDAATAAMTAVVAFDKAPFAAPAQALEQMHAVMRGTRGAAVALAHVDLEARTVRLTGAGNVATRLVSGLEDRSLVTQHGTVGVQLARVQTAEHILPPHALVIMHTDGITSRWNFDAAPGILQHHPAVIAGWIMRDHCRGRDDATVLVLKKRNG
ncbi:MAG: ATP-binding protein/SpoIIE family protein phosphatase [Herbaspirillum sp.]